MATLQRFRETATALQLFLPNSKTMPHDQMLFILSVTCGDSLFEVAEFFGLAALAGVTVIHTLVKANAHEIFFSRKLAKLLVMDEASVKIYCIKKKFSLADKRRLLKWSRWAQSAERAAVEGRFKRMNSETR